MITPEQTEAFKKMLLEEKNKIEEELATVSRPNPDNPGDWEPAKTHQGVINEADENERADAQEEFAENTNISGQLELQLKDVVAALKKIEDGTYGVCEISGETIELERLEANAAARTCKTHINDHK